MEAQENAQGKERASTQDMLVIALAQKTARPHTIVSSGKKLSEGRERISYVRCSCGQTFEDVSIGKMTSDMVPGVINCTDIFNFHVALELVKSIRSLCDDEGNPRRATKAALDYAATMSAAVARGEGKEPDENCNETPEQADARVGDKKRKSVYRRATNASGLLGTMFTEIQKSVVHDKEQFGISMQPSKARDMVLLSIAEQLASIAGSLESIDRTQLRSPR